MKNESIRKHLDAHVREAYGIEPETLPFSHAEYEIYRHTESGKSSLSLLSRNGNPLAYLVKGQLKSSA